MTPIIKLPPQGGFAQWQSLLFACLSVPSSITSATKCTKHPLARVSHMFYPLQKTPPWKLWLWRELTRCIHDVPTCLFVSHYFREQKRRQQCYWTTTANYCNL